MKLNDPFSFYLEGTNGKGVILIHGLTGIPAEMKFIARALNRKGYTIYAPLLAGHGIDHQTLKKSTWQDWLDGIVESARVFSSEVDSVYTAGICVGGKLGMLAAQCLPDTIRATAIYSPCFQFDGWNTPWLYKFSPALPMMVRLFPSWRDKTYPETESLGIKDERLRNFMQGAEAKGVIDEFPAVSLVEMQRLGKALKRELKRVKTPTLILHAEKDDLSHPRNAIAIAKHLVAPHELHWIEDSYHMIHVDRQRDKVADLTASFFERYYVDAA
ncbi:MAG: alpha/beta fold hydrolase [Proteobacteria bacterium]|nr:alpha/beta fold hydrolase [Pseudomonadota bacterium]